jgi:DNA polymerase-3 subunit alpha
LASDEQLREKYRALLSVAVKDGRVSIDEAKSAHGEMEEMLPLEGLKSESVLHEFDSIVSSSAGKQGDANSPNSWLAYAAGLTSKKPDGQFMAPRRVFARAGFPDIDADFEFERRQEVYDYIIERYGRENVGNIGTYQTLKMKSYITRAVKALDLSNAFHLGKDEYTKRNNMLVREIIDSLPEQRGAFLKVFDDDGEEHQVVLMQDAFRYCDAFRAKVEKFPDLVGHAEKMEGLSSSFGVHAAGIVISSEPLQTIAPLRSSSGGDGGGVDFATQFPYEDLEYIGLIKFDILALSTLSVISECLRMLESRRDIKLDITNLPLDDRATFEVYRTGRLVGVFQCEERGMQKTMIQMRVDRFEDVCAGIALFRPGPMANIPFYCARKNGAEKIDYFHPSIEPFVKSILEPTYGVLCYQESIMQICNSLAGFTISEGYQVIKAVGKKKGDYLAKFKNRFVKGCVANGVPEGVADKYWTDFIMPFAAYGFNKSHSYCYGLLSYQTAYLKANYPHEFMLAYLNVETRQKKWERVDQLESEAKGMGMTTAPRQINSSSTEWVLNISENADGSERALLIPPLMCKGIRVAAAENIFKNQRYKNFEDFCAKVDPGVVDSECVLALKEAGFFKNIKDPVGEWNKYREHFKKARAKGMTGKDMFA